MSDFLYNLAHRVDPTLSWRKYTKEVKGGKRKR